MLFFFLGGSGLGVVEALVKGGSSFICTSKENRGLAPGAVYGPFPSAAASLATRPTWDSLTRGPWHHTKIHGYVSR